MFFLIVVLYFFLACFIAWLIIFESGRDRFFGFLLGIWKGLGRLLTGFKSGLSSKYSGGKQTVRVSAKLAAKNIKQYYWLLLAALAIISIPPIVAFSLGRMSRLDGFDTSFREANIQVAEVLMGERLVPPAPLPPQIFTTQEVLLIRPQLATASRNWGKLNPDFEQYLLQVFMIMKENYGYEMAILEGYRSPERQNMLARMGSHVTNAKAYQSYHQFGLAADCAFLRNGRLVISEKDPWAMRGYQLYGQVAESVGLRWGGRWRMMDFGHVELPRPKVLLRS